MEVKMEIKIDDDALSIATRSAYATAHCFTHCRFIAWSLEAAVRWLAGSS